MLLQTEGARLARRNLAQRAQDSTFFARAPSTGRSFRPESKLICISPRKESNRNKKKQRTSTDGDTEFTRGVDDADDDLFEINTEEKSRAGCERTDGL